MLTIQLCYGQKNIKRYIISLVIVQISWNSLYLLHILISLLIYPIMLRSKGFGLNISLGTIGKLVIMLLIDFKDQYDYILYFFVFNFFVLVISYALPDRIGSFVIDSKKNQEEKNSDANNENLEEKRLNEIII